MFVYVAHLCTRNFTLFGKTKNRLVHLKTMKARLHLLFHFPHKTYRSAIFCRPGVLTGRQSGRHCRMPTLRRMRLAKICRPRIEIFSANEWKVILDPRYYNLTERVTRFGGYATALLRWKHDRPIGHFVVVHSQGAALLIADFNTMAFNCPETCGACLSLYPTHCDLRVEWISALDSLITNYLLSRETRKLCLTRHLLLLCLVTNTLF